MSKKFFIIFISVVGAVVALAATLTAFCIIREKQKKEEEELEHYLDSSILKLCLSALFFFVTENSEAVPGYQRSCVRLSVRSKRPAVCFALPCAESIIFRIIVKKHCFLCAGYAIL